MLRSSRPRSNDAVLDNQKISGAGSLVTPGKTLESGHLYVGSPVKKARSINESEARFLDYSPQNYVRLKNRYLADG